jgi:hypothetical protein
MVGLFSAILITGMGLMVTRCLYLCASPFKWFRRVVPFWIYLESVPISRKTFFTEVDGENSMLLVSGYEGITGINRIFIVYSFLALIIGAFIIAILTLMKRRTTEVRASKFYLLGISLFAALFGLGRLIFLIHDYYTPDELGSLVYLIGSIVTLSGLTILAFTIEKFIFQKTKKLITIFGVICLVVMVFTTGDISKYAYIGGQAIVTALPFFIYIYIAKISTGAVRKQAVFIILGIVMVFISIIGGAVLSNLHVLDQTGSQLFGIVFSFIGLILLSYGLVKTPTTK